MSKPPTPTFVSMADAMDAIRKMDGHEPGPWWVWGDDTTPKLRDVDYDTMKKFVDEGQANGQLDLYGENTKTNAIYEGGKE